METEGTRDMAIDNIVLSPLNPRQQSDPETLAPLVQSIREHGMIGPVLVRPTGAGSMWECIAGGR
ncbi:MAG TPA: ParB N-terminal domain-containing protein, partial [Armatimonadota bacterium]|nr:ParB N-terminal domain-containing protein [Armatimonadota bacterium]